MAKRTRKKIPKSETVKKPRLSKKEKLESKTPTETRVPELITVNKGFFSRFFRWRWKPNLCPGFLDDMTLQLLIVIPLLIMLGLVIWKILS